MSLSISSKISSRGSAIVMDTPRSISSMCGHPKSNFRFRKSNIGLRLVKGIDLVDYMRCIKSWGMQIDPLERLFFSYLDIINEAIHFDDKGWFFRV